jgi:DNA-binding SARP family transcriptional activator
MSMLKVRLLGTFEVKYEDRSIQISGRPAQSLFAYLILNGRIFHRREKLGAMLWPDSTDAKARENLRHTLWRIRKSLPPTSLIEYLLADNLAITFNPSAEYWLDVIVLKTASQCLCADDLISALSVYQGELLPGFYEEWVTLEREYLNSLFEHNMARLMAILQSEYRWLDILDWGERWLAFGQKPEPAYRALMNAHMRKGEMSKVAETYARCVRSLAEIGLEPSDQTRELYDSLKKGNIRQP